MVPWLHDIARDQIRAAAIDLWSAKAYEASATLFVDERRSLGIFSRRAFVMRLRKTYELIPADSFARKFFTGGVDDVSMYVDRYLREAVRLMGDRDRQAQALAASTRPPSPIDRMVDEACGVTAKVTR